LAESEGVVPPPGIPPDQQVLILASRRLAFSAFRLYGEPLPVNAPLKDSVEGTSVQLHLPQIEVQNKRCVK
jgi:hypothetical protein